MRRAAVALVVAVAAVGAAGAAPAGALVVGIGDQKADMFTDPLFARLGISHARIAVAWDVLQHGWQRDELDQWMAGARADHVQPLVSFGHARDGYDRRVLPTPSRFKYEFRLFRARYPWVTTFASWNEANHCGEPTCHRPALVAAYYRAMRRECPHCTLLAAEVLDMPNMGRWLDQFQHALGFRPHLWGLHNYIDANRLRTSGTRTLLRHTRGQVWFTETGGIVHRANNPRKVTFPESSAHAAIATRWVFHRLVPLSRRITRVYVYHWNAAAHDNWDSGLINSRGRPRKALGVVRSVLRAAAQRRQKRLTSASARPPTATR